MLMPSIAGFSSLALRCKAEVRVECRLPRGEVEVCRVEIPTGPAAPAME